LAAYGKPVAAESRTGLSDFHTFSATIRSPRWFG
jgi:hypothetical protein